MPGFEIDGLTPFQQHPVRPAAVPDYLFATQLHYPAFVLPEQVLTAHSLNLIGGSQAAIRTELLNRTSQLCLESVMSAIVQAGLEPSSLTKYRVGVSLGTTVGCTFNDESYYLQWRQGKHPDVAPLERYFANNLAETVQASLNLAGPCAVITNACASGTDAIGLAKTWIEQGLCDIAIAGGADELSRIAYHGFAGLMLLSDKPCRPFDLKRNGLNLGEGSGILILERDDFCKRRGALPFGMILGYGVASDCYHPTAPHPEGHGLIKALSMALADSGIAGQEIGYINAHGTGTLANDATEALALSKVNLGGDCPVVSTKGMTGHMLGAAGAVEAIITIKSLQQGQCRGSFGCRQLDPDLPCTILTEDESASLNSRIGISQSLAFGGGNSVLVLEGYS